VYQGLALTVSSLCYYKENSECNEGPSTSQGLSSTVLDKQVSHCKGKPALAGDVILAYFINHIKEIINSQTLQLSKDPFQFLSPKYRLF
jgi:hypothetical protein